MHEALEAQDGACVVVRQTKIVCTKHDVRYGVRGICIRGAMRDTGVRGGQRARSMLHTSHTVCKHALLCMSKRPRAVDRALPGMQAGRCWLMWQSPAKAQLCRQCRAQLCEVT